MPFYPYSCSACKEQFRVFHGMEEKIEDCPNCGEKAVERMLNVPIAYKQEKEVVEKPGDLTKRSIREFKEELEEQRRKMREREI